MTAELADKFTRELLGKEEGEKFLTAFHRVAAWLEQQENDLRGGGYRTAQEFHQVDRIEFERILADLRTVLL